jgi:hypothetical protein
LSKYLKLDLANEHPRRSVELYAEFGIAAEKAQVLEVAAGPGLAPAQKKHDRGWAQQSR